MARLLPLAPHISRQRVVVLCPDVGPVIAMRNYPKEKYAEAVKKLLSQDPSMLVLLVGVKKDMPTCRFIQQAVSDSRCVNFCGRTSSIHELVELISLSDLYIGNDNGPAHFASLTKTKILALFSTDSPNMYGPLGDCVVLYSYFQCSPCISAWNHKYSVCDNNLCLKAISPDTVARFAIEHMAGRLKARTVNNELCYI
jgi:ADP-heptose:LPS heptosyltransferase